jgi:hypothetical protein
MSGLLHVPFVFLSEIGWRAVEAIRERQGAGKRNR